MEWLETWNGYLPPTSNTTYTPNQFFDVVLPTSSRGVVRLVAFLIRQTLGWSDAYGRPQNANIKISYRELERRAGIARSMLRPALDEALAARFIECVEEGHADALGAPGASALYKLRWDARKTYVTDPTEFEGFFAGNGNLTYIPNQFFDDAIPNEPLAIVRVVGAVIRHTIGWQTEYGFRRQQVAMSFTELEMRTGLSRQSVNVALQTALLHRHLIRVEAGVFDADATRQKAAVYGIKWADQNAAEASPPPYQPAPPQPPARKVDQGTERDGLEKLTRERARKVDQNGLENFTRTGSKTLPDNGLEKLTSIEITPKEIKEEIKQEKQQQIPPPQAPMQTPFAAAAFSISSQPEYNLLRERGLGHKAALEFSVRPKSELDGAWELVRKKHKPGMSLTGLYCAALRDNWLGEQKTMECARLKDTAQTPRKPVRTAQQALREKNMPLLQSLFSRLKTEMPERFEAFETFRQQARAAFSKRFSLEVARKPALQGFDGEENTLKLLLLFLEKNPCPFPDMQEWIDRQTPAELLKMFV